MTDYSKSKVYLIYLPGLEEFGYIGSTIKDLPQRLSEHKSSAKSNRKYKFSSSVLWECEENEPEIKCLEKVCCKTRQELLQRERYWLDQYPDAVNKHDPVLSPEERHERAKACVLKCYYNKREERIQKHKEWVEANKEHTAEYRAGRKDISKAQYKARYDAGYKHKRSEAKRVKVECPVCKKVMNKNSIWEHTKKIHTPVTP